MKAELITSFPPFRLDTVNQQLWCGSRPIELRRKTFLVLQYLAEHPGQLITKEELRKAVWSGVYVSDTVLKVCIHELRRVFEERPAAPRFIETMHGRGYRFIGQLQKEVLQAALVKSRQSEAQEQMEHQPQHSTFPTDALDPRLGSIFLKPFNPNNFTLQEAALSSQSHFFSSHHSSAPPSVFIDRDKELAQLHSWRAKAFHGERQFVFVSGEPGVGKTATVEEFLTQAAMAGSPWVARGLCIEHHGTEEPYFPVLDAFSRLCREPGHQRFVTILHRYAPSWLARMPSLLSAAERRNLSRLLAGTSHERMLRELTQVLEVLTQETPLIFVMEDLLWCDSATLDFLSFFARGKEPARFLFIGVHRPLEMVTNIPPLEAVKQDLLTHQHCRQLFISPFTTKTIDQYLHARFPTNAFPESFSAWLYECTEGNPLFIATVVNHLVTLGVIAQHDNFWWLTTEVRSIPLEIPANLQAVIEEQKQWLSPQETRILQAASIVGLEFSTALVMAALGADFSETEAICEHLARRKLFLRQCGLTEWPDGTVATRYRFIHTFYRQAWYNRVTPAQTVFWHKKVAERLEKAYAEQAQEVAMELALHFARGRERWRAAQYLEKAADSVDLRGVGGVLSYSP